MIKQIFKTCIFVIIFLLGTSCGSGEREEVENMFFFAEFVDDLNTFVSVIEYIDRNGSQEDSNDLQVMLQKKNEDENFTFFMPNNLAFNGIDQTSDGIFNREDFTALEASLGSAQAAADALYLMITNHAVSKKLLSTNFDSELDIITIAEETTSDSTNFGLKASPRDPSFAISGSYTPSTALIQSADNITTNGLIHIIDEVLLDSASAESLGMTVD